MLGTLFLFSFPPMNITNQLDVKDVKFVINYDMPETDEMRGQGADTYLHRVSTSADEGGWWGEWQDDYGCVMMRQFFWEWVERGWTSEDEMLG